MCFPQFYNKVKLWVAGPARYVQTSGRLKTEHVYSAYSSNTVRLVVGLRLNMYTVHTVAIQSD